MAPIRTAIIGLSSTAATSWASTAHLPSLVTPAGQSRFQIVALLNSSVSAAEFAIKTYDLPPGTRAYGSPEDLAADPAVDLVICSTRVDRHYETVLPSVRAGKDVYVEWPVAATDADIRSLADEARRSGSTALVGLQGRWAAPVLKLRELLDAGAIGKVLSVDVRAYGGTKDRETLPVGLKYFADRGVGGNPITIGFGHVFDFVQSVVGDVVPETTGSRLQLQRRRVRVRDPENGEVVETVRSNVPDLLYLHGRLAESPRNDADATLAFTFRRGQPFPGTPSLAWSIYGVDGEIRLVAPAGISLQADACDESVTIQVHDFDTDTVRDVEWDWTDVEKQVPVRGRSVQRVLYAYADWKQGKSDGAGAWVGVDDAAARTSQIQKLLDGFEG
ncbi:Galactose/lactose metabolism regulatory protein GAL80 [Metarhizium brunneum]|uniref:Galactose/lactose metabolism regulatory protein GAL80 n=1 Tax=Metarhizium brunneum TaxID=500148 RepID=A0A7D5UT41_9HYPO